MEMGMNLVFSAMGINAIDGIPDMTTIVYIEEGGQVMTRREGFQHVSTINLEEFLPPQLIADAKAVKAEIKELRRMATEAETLQAEVAELETSTAHDKVRLRFEVWGLFPQYFGVDNLDLTNDGGVIRLINQCGEHLQVVEGETGTAIATRWQRIEDNEELIRTKKRGIELLKLKVSRLPELIEVKRDEVNDQINRAIQEGNPQLWDMLCRGEVFIDTDEQGVPLVYSEFVEVIYGMDPLTKDLVTMYARHDALSATARQLLGLNAINAAESAASEPAPEDNKPADE
ncbi:MAG: hypothetical protein WCX08_03895 [Candidatus Buchananbacteria bacterium]|jgi:hypothetical protein